MRLITAQLIWSAKPTIYKRRMMTENQAAQPASPCWKCWKTRSERYLRGGYPVFRRNKARCRRIDSCIWEVSVWRLKSYRSYGAEADADYAYISGLYVARQDRERTERISFYWKISIMRIMSNLKRTLKKKTKTSLSNGWQNWRTARVRIQRENWRI